MIVVGVVLLILEDGPMLPADFDMDGRVAGTDFLIWQENFPSRSGTTHAMGDADGDGTVCSSYDFLIWQAAFQANLGAGASILPDPVGIGLGLLKETFRSRDGQRRETNGFAADRR